MTLEQRPNVGEKVKRIAADNGDTAQGNEYLIINIDVDGDPEFIDDRGHTNYIARDEYANYELVVAPTEDPGYFEVHTKPPTDLEDGELFAIEVTVDLKGYERLRALEVQHVKAVEAARLQAMIKSLQDQLKRL